MKIQSITRALAITRLVAAADGIMLADLASRTGLNKTTAYHLAQTLVAEGMLAKDAAARYHIGTLPGMLLKDSRKSGRETLILRELAPFHKRFPDASIVVSDLGDADIFSRFMFNPGKPGELVRSDDMTLNPYTTVAGVLFFAFTPEERLRALKSRHPFDLKGRDAWGKEDAFTACVERARTRGWSETPPLVPKTTFKIGIPVFDTEKNITAAITFT
ncbi:MAG: helix-turn-helix domain-containing protein, partial [Spirochaetota bacterium]